MTCAFIRHHVFFDLVNLFVFYFFIRNFRYFSWTDFDKSCESGLNKPFFTYILLFVCTITLFYSFYKNDWVLEPFAINPMFGPSADTLLSLGAKRTSNIVQNGEWYRLFTPMFLHAGVIHYTFNMMALWFIGSAVEKTHGFLAAATLFVIPAVGGLLLSAIFLPQSISVGASGGIFGLIGACLVDIVMNWSLLFSKGVNHDDSATTLRNIKIVLLLLIDIGVNCIIGLTPLVDNFTHLGGMIYGYLVGMSIIQRVSSEFFGEDKGFLDRLKRIFLRFLGLIICVASIIVTIALLAKSDGITTPCEQCRFFSCVPFPPWASDEKKWWYCDDCALASARARENSNRIIFQLILTCPDDQVEIVDISDESISDLDTLAAELPHFCRRFCDNVLV